MQTLAFAAIAALSIDQLFLVGKAATRNLVDFDETIQRLINTGFYVSPGIIAAVKQSFSLHRRT